jgi:hypothetical protein
MALSEPRALLRALNFLDVTAELVLGHPLVNRPPMDRSALLAQDAANENDFVNGMAVLTEVLRDLRVPGRTPSFAVGRLGACLARELPTIDQVAVERATELLDQIRIVRNSSIHPKPDTRLLEAHHALGLPFPVQDFTTAWDSVRGHAEQAVLRLQEEIQSARTSPDDQPEAGPASTYDRRRPPGDGHQQPDVDHTHWRRRRTPRSRRRRAAVVDDHGKSRSRLLGRWSGAVVMPAVLLGAVVVSGPHGRHRSDHQQGIAANHLDMEIPAEIRASTMGRSRFGRCRCCQGQGDLTEGRQHRHARVAARRRIPVFILRKAVEMDFSIDDAPAGEVPPTPSLHSRARLATAIFSRFFEDHADASRAIRADEDPKPTFPQVRGRRRVLQGSWE